jgi:thioredoxin 1
MAFTHDYLAQEPSRSEIDSLPGATLLEFGAPWCGHCMAAQSPLAAAMSRRTDLRHLKVEDGKGQPLGRSFRIKLWPTLVVLRDGEELARVVRPSSGEEIEQALAALGEG